MSWTIGVDVGGTFTDFYAVDDATGDVRVSKRPSTPENPAQAILLGLEEMSKEHGIDLKSVSRLGHGTTVGTNALIQRRGANIAVITTQGFRDLLEIGRQTRPHMFDMFLDHRAPLASSENRFEVNERITADGTVIEALDEASLHDAVDAVGKSGADAVAVCCLFSFISPDHERRIGEVLRQKLPSMHISLSSDVQPEFREYERFSTTAINATLQPVMTQYIEDLEQGIKTRMPGATVGINQSSGGLMSPDRAQALPVRTALSGPAAGAVGAVYVAEQLKIRDVITLDMGGTSADVAMIRDGGCELSFDRDVAGFPIRLPMVDIETVGAGGGSIAWFERDGLMKVGPVSAGADPGPACYGRGGDKPTVSDANLVLGRLSSGGLLGGAMALDVELARKAVSTLAQEMNMSVERVAHGVVSVVVANMVRTIRTVSVERGHDPRKFALMPFGGAGPLHATDVARALGQTTIVVPLSPGIVCAQGLVVSELKEDFVRSRRTRVDTEGIGAINDQLSELGEEAKGWFATEASGTSSQRLEYRLDMRYVGQNFELAVALDSPDSVSVESLKESFFAVHERSYGYFNADDDIEMVNARLTAFASLRSDQDSEHLIAQKQPGEVVGTRTVWFDADKAIEADCYIRDALSPGQRIDGPAVVDQLDTTTLIYPGDSAVVDQYGNLIVSLGA